MLGGISAILDHDCSALSVAAVAAAALSCEALRADVGAFNLMDSGDGFVYKDVIGVADDLKVLLNGSKLVGHVECEEVSDIPQIYGALREEVRSMHSWTRVELNSSAKNGKGGRAGRVQPLAEALWRLGESSLRRLNMNIYSICNEDMQSHLQKLLPNFSSLSEEVKVVSGAFSDALLEKYVEPLHETNKFAERVASIVAWEAITAFVSLEGNDLIVQGSGASNTENVDKRSEKKKKKKKILGKGTDAIVQLIKDRVQNTGQVGDNSPWIEGWVKGLCSLLDCKEPAFGALLNKLKEILESNESRRLPKIPKGTRDFAREKMTVREEAFSVIKKVFKRHGSTALDTPVFELRETLMGKYGEDSKLIYDLADQGGELCSLRYDLTVPFARYMAMNGITSMKRYHIGKVYRRENPSHGRYREFYQCDFDIAGQQIRMGPDAEVVKVLTELLDELDIGDYEVKLNHRVLLDGMLEICGVPPEKFRTICSSIDKLDKLPYEQIKKEMVNEKGLTEETADKIGIFLKDKGAPFEVLYKLKREGSKFLEHIGSVLALNDLEILFEVLADCKCLGKIVFDLSLARGLDYYTGVIFEAVFKGTTQVGTIGAGGRYDNLIGQFGTRQVPAVGMSLGIERVLAIMEQQRLQEDGKRLARATETQVLVSILGDPDQRVNLREAMKLTSELWGAELKADYMVNKRMQKLIERATESRIPYMVIQGDKERNEGKVVLKDTEANQQGSIDRDKVVEELTKRLMKTV